MSVCFGTFEVFVSINTKSLVSSSQYAGSVYTHPKGRPGITDSASGVFIQGSAEPEQHWHCYQITGTSVTWTLFLVDSHWDSCWNLGKRAIPCISHFSGDCQSHCAFLLLGLLWHSAKATGILKKWTQISLWFPSKKLLTGLLLSTLLCGDSCSQQFGNKNIQEKAIFKQKGKDWQGWEKAEFPNISTGLSSVCFCKSCFLLHQKGRFWLHRSQ